MGHPTQSDLVPMEYAIAPSPRAKPSASPRPTSLYFVNGIVDYSVIGGVSVLTYVILYVVLAQGRDQRYQAAITITALLAWVCNWPHFSATNYRLYHSYDNIMQYPLTALVVPWFIFAAMIGAIVSPLVIAPYFVKLFFWWSGYHFCGQSFGISMIYARRAGFPIGRWARLGLTTFIYGSFLVAASSAEVIPEGGPSSHTYYGITYQALGVPGWVPLVFQGMMWAGGLLFLVFALKWCIEKKRLLPPIILVPAAAQFVWFVLAISVEPFNDFMRYCTFGLSAYISPLQPVASFTEFIPFFHSLQYLLIAWSMQLKEKMDLKEITPSTRYVLGESLRWGLLNIAGGALLFICFPLVTWAVVQGVSPSAFLSAARDLFVHNGLTAPSTPSLLFYIGVTIAAVQIHHFFVDGVIWKLKRKSVSSPLMVNLSDMLAPTQAG